MDYNRTWKRRRAEVQALAHSESSESDSDFHTVHRVPSGSQMHSEGPSESLSRRDFEAESVYLSSEDSELEENRHPNPHKTFDFSKELRIWACKNKLSRSAVGEMLTLLRRAGHQLPKDPRTFLSTPRTVTVQEKCGGYYTYFGLEFYIEKIIANNPAYLQDHNSIELHVNIDGVPLFKSTSDQFWPILVTFSTFRPFLVAIFLGKSKPNSLGYFLEDFLEEYSRLKVSGIRLMDKVLTVSVKCFICDAPARSFLKCIKGHTGYPLRYSCAPLWLSFG